MKAKTIGELSNDWAKGFTFMQLGDAGKIAVMLERINGLESQLKAVELKINRDNPDCFELTNPTGDTYSFNPLSESGEELDNFFYYLENQIEK